MERRLTSHMRLKNPENRNLEQFYDFNLKILNFNFKFQK
jgi:hypothetical protein